MTLEIIRLHTQPAGPDTKTKPDVTPEWVVAPELPEVDEPVIINPKRPDRNPKVAPVEDPATWGR